MATDFTEPILHVDMDAFFVEVERLGNPSLRGRPVVVGGTGPRAVVAAASYEAREFGVASAMPMAEALRRCPQAQVVPPDRSSYCAASARVFEILEAFTPFVEAVSIDEAFLDVRGLRLHHESPADVAARIRSRIGRELRLPASVGGGVNKFIAKLASEAAKPDGALIVSAGTELEFLRPLSVRRLWGVGEATFAALEAMGVSTVGELGALPVRTLEHRLGRSLGRHLWELARGRDERVVHPEREAKSISVEETYAEDLHDEQAILDALMEHCDRLSSRLNDVGLAGRTITVKVRFDDFTTITRSTTVADPVDHTPDLWDLAGQLVARIELGAKGVRLLGVGASSLVPGATPRQLSFEHPGRDDAAAAAEAVRARFGRDAVVPARLAPRPDPTRRRETPAEGS